MEQYWEKKNTRIDPVSAPLLSQDIPNGPPDEWPMINSLWRGAVPMK
jgi:hypothetical protein